MKKATRRLNLSSLGNINSTPFNEDEVKAEAEAVDMVVLEGVVVILS